MDEVNKKAIERMGDILDAIKAEVDTITGQSNTHDDDFIASDTIYNLTRAFCLIYGNMNVNMKGDIYGRD